MSVINEYISFKRKNMIKYLKTIMNRVEFSSFESFVIDMFCNIYFQSYYYGIYETIDIGDNLKTDDAVKKELYGKKLELLKSIDDSEVLEEYNAYIRKINDINEIYKKMLVILDIDQEDLYLKPLAKMIKSDIKKEEKFLDLISCNDFKIRYHKFKNYNDFKFIDMTYNIKKLERSYKKSVIDQVYNSSSLDIARIMTMLKILETELLIKMINHDNCGKYFITITEMFLQNKENLTALLNLLDNVYVKDHVVILIPNKVYKRHSAYFKRMIGKYQFGLLIDFSHIMDVSVKLDSLNENKLFDFIIVEKAKSDDYTIICNYESDNKKIMMYEFDDE